MTMQREVALRIGAFDERFGAGAPLRSAEDTDYLVRAYRLGIPVEYVPDMAVFHHHGRRARTTIETLHRNYSFGNGALCVKHIRTAPWLLRHFCWTLRSACAEIFGGPRFDPVLHLSHWPIALMNLLGALKFLRLFVAARTAGQVEQRWVLVDARDKVLGRLAAKIASRLRGKHRPEYTPHVDTGDFVVVVNAAKLRVTGRKAQDKLYIRHTGYPGGIRQSNFAKLQAKRPERALQHAVKGMLPKGPLGYAMMRKLKVYAGETHPHSAQQPKSLEL